MLERILDMGTGIYILWGIGFFGLFLKLIAGTYLNGMLRASENMSTTKKRSLRIIRQKYENGRRLGINTGSGEAYAEKSIRRLRLIAMPLEFWCKSGQVLALVICMVLAGGFLYYDVSWRGSPDMAEYMANGVIVCAFLLALENIFLINNKVEMLKANVRDYIENLTPAREEKGRRRHTVVTEGRRNAGSVGDSAAADKESAATLCSGEGGNDGETVPATSVYDERASNDDILNSFLREFFS